jgi:hypothetical protein
MGKPIATKNAEFICFAFPDVCLTPSPSGATPIPYPNVGYLSDAEGTSIRNGRQGEVQVAGKTVVLITSSIPANKTTGDEAGTAGGGVNSGTTKGRVDFKSASNTVQIHSQKVVRQTDTTEQNSGNARGSVLGGVPNVLVGD